MFLSSYRNTSGSLREQEMLWEPMYHRQGSLSLMAKLPWNPYFSNLILTHSKSHFPFTICSTQTLILPMISRTLDNLNHFLGGSRDHDCLCLCIKILAKLNKELEGLIITPLLQQGQWRAIASRCTPCP